MHAIDGRLEKAILLRISKKLLPEDSSKNALFYWYFVRWNHTVINVSRAITRGGEQSEFH